MMKNTLFIIVLFLLSRLVATAQFYPQQSLYTYNPLPVNGAAAGKDDALSVTLSHRSMWKGIVGAPRTQYLTIHMPLKNENIAIGIQAFNDEIGVTRHSGISFTGAYRLMVKKGARLSMGITAGMISNSNRWSDIETTTQGDMVFEAGDQAYWLPNVGASVYYYDKKSYVGISVPYFLTETYSGGGVYKAAHVLGNYSYHMIAGHRFNFSHKMYLRPSFLMKYHAASGLQADLTGAVGHNQYGEVGLTIRPGQAVVGLLQARLNDQIRISYGYDYVLGTLSHYERGTHEFALMYTFIYHSNAPNTRFF